jgi:subtilisin-like proprotein convertase family protein
MQYTDAIPMAPQGDHVAFAVLDTEGTLPEGNRGNNVSLGFAWTTTQDTIHTSFGVPSAPIYVPPDGTMVESMLTVDIGAAVPSDFWVTLNMTHPEILDLQIDAIAPDGTVTPLVMGSPSGADLGGTTFRTAAALTFAEGAPPFVGEYQPAMAWPNPIATYNGMWTLRVTDLVPDNGNDGEVNDWSVSMRAP